MIETILNGDEESTTPEEGASTEETPAEEKTVDLLDGDGDDSSQSDSDSKEGSDSDSKEESAE